MKTRKIIAIALSIVLMFAFASSAMAYNQIVRGMNIPANGTNKVLGNQPRECNDGLHMAIYSDSVFNGQANMTFRLYSVGGSRPEDRRSNAISFYPTDSSTPKHAPFLNGGASASYLDLRASTSGTSIGLFSGSIQF